MSTDLIEKQVWDRITEAAKSCRRPAAVAVAYFNEGKARLLPLRRGSRLVVDASEAAVKAGQTHPADLLWLQKRRGVRIFSVENLHAKVFVFGGQAFVGSANVSQRSANVLIEATLRTTDRSAVKAARAFVRGLCIQELGPEALERLNKLYRPPKFPDRTDGERSGKRNGRAQAKLTGMRLIHLEWYDPPAASEWAEEQGRRSAQSKRHHRGTHDLQHFHWPNDSIHPGETIVQVMDEDGGSQYVYPPGEVVSIRRWSNGRQRCTFVYLEVPRRRRIRIKKLGKDLGRGAIKRLRRAGSVSTDFAEKLRKAWQR
jgi:hypothetical protein